MSEEPKITVFYEKFYTDDTGKHIPDLLSKNTYDGMCIKTYWGNVVDAFYKYGCLYMFTAITGDFRIVTAYEYANGYKFNQFFVSGLDGKVIKIPKHTWFGINNLNNDVSALIMAKVGNAANFDVLKPSVFDWHSKR